MRFPCPTLRYGLLLTLVFGHLACRTEHADTPPPKQQADSLKKVTVAQWGQERYLIYLPLYVAIEEGFLRSQGLEVSIKFTGNDDQTFAAVISGDAQFGIGDPVFAAISKERGFPAKVVGTVVGGVAIWGVTNNPKVPAITKPGDLSGLRVGTFPEPSTNYTLMKETIEANPSLLAKTKIVQAPIGSQVALLEAGSADIAMELEPATSIAESQGYRVVYSSPQFYGPFAFTGVTTTDEVIGKNPEIVQSFVSGLEKALAACHSDPRLAVQVGKKLFPSLDSKVVERAVNRMITESTFPSHVVVDEKAWQRALKARISVGDLKVPQETSETVDNSFALKAQG